MNNILAFPFSLRVIIFIVMTLIVVALSLCVFVGFVAKKRRVYENLYVELLSICVLALSIARTPLLGATKYLFFTLSGYFMIAPMIYSIVMIFVNRKLVYILDFVMAFVNLPFLFVVNGWEYVYLASVVACFFRAFTYCVNFVVDLRSKAGGYAPKFALEGLTSGVAFANPVGQIAFINEYMISVLDDIDVSSHNRMSHIKEDIFKKASQNGKIINDTSVDVYVGGKTYNFVFDETQISCTDITQEELLSTKLETSQQALANSISMVEKIGREKAVLGAKINAQSALADNMAILDGVISTKTTSSNISMLKKLVPVMLAQRNEHDVENARTLLGGLIKNYAMLKVKVKINGDLPTNEIKALAIVRVIREAITNAVGHGGATEVDVQLLSEGEKTICMITNNGAICADFEEGTGIAGMRYQMSEVDGTLDISTTNGFTVIAMV